MAKEVTKGPSKDRKLPVDLSLLKDEDKAALRAEAKKSIVAEMEQDARDKFFADEMAKLRRGKIPDEALHFVIIDAAPYVPFIMLDGTQFFHGYTYEVRGSVAAVLFEQMQRSWQHQDEIDGRSKANAYRTPNNRRIGSQHAGTPTRGFSTAAIVDAEI